MSSGLRCVFTPPHLGETSPSYHQSPSHSFATSPRLNATLRFSNESCRRKENDSNQNGPPSPPQGKSATSTFRFRERSNTYLKRKAVLESMKNKQKRRKGNEGIVLPTKFLLGGNIHDPLNLASFSGDNQPQVTPASSPLPTPKHKKEVEVLIPANINDPLNLSNAGDLDDSTLASPLKKARHHRYKKKRKRTESETTHDEEEAVATEQKDTSKGDGGKQEEVSEVKKILSHNKNLSFEPWGQRKDVSRIVSPALPQGAPHFPHRHSFRDFNQSQGFRQNRRARRNRNQSERYHPKNELFKYGNYNRYYGYRNRGTFTDPRLSLLKKEWFEGKEVLDIGCNTGQITLTIAKEFSPSLIIGLDIDENLIKTAQTTLSKRLNQRNFTSPLGDRSPFPMSLGISKGPLIAPAVVSNDPSPSLFPKNVIFIESNFVLEKDEDLLHVQPEYDCILCLSVTKWVHLNWGDAGIKRMFKRISLSLRPSGRLILEPQSWSSYCKRHKLTVSRAKTCINMLI